MAQNRTSLSGKLLIAMPNLADPRFHKTVIFICSHDENGAMGIVTNQYLPNMVMDELFKEIGCDVKLPEHKNVPVLLGGPVETSRGFLIHTTDYDSPETIKVNGKFGVTGTIEALKSYAEGNGPKDMIFALGYAGWSGGQLEEEILANSWLIVDADCELVFNTDVLDRWDRAMSRHGIDPARLSGDAGHA